MTSTIFSKKNFLVLAGILLAGILAITLTSLPKNAGAAMVTGDMHGYAWSDTIGWISLNCAEGSSTGGSNCSTSNYKVSVVSNNFTGYAWSDNVGWISFKSADVALCGGSSPTLNDTTGEISGWVRVLSAPTTSAANGCISLRGSGYGLRYDAATPSPHYPSYKKVSGFAWGDLVVGWTDFTYAALDGGVSTSGLWVNRTTYTDQTVVPSTLHQQVGEYWIKNTGTTESVGLTKLTIKFNPDGVLMTNFTNFRVTLDGVPVSATFTPVAGSPDTYTVNVAPKTLSVGTAVGNTTVVDIFADFGIATSGTLSTTLIANGNGVTTGVGVNSGTAITGQTMTIGTVAPTSLNLRVNGMPTYVFTTSAGGPVTFSWTAGSGIRVCTAVRDTIDSSEVYWYSGDPSPVTLPTGWKGPVTIPANTTSSLARHVYGLNCTTSTGSSISDTVTVDVPGTVPSVDMKVNGVDGPIAIPYGGAVALSWTSTDVTSCSVDPAYMTDPTYWGAGTSRATSQALPPGWVIVVPSGPRAYTYGIKCTNGSAFVEDRVQITVDPTITPTTTAGGTGGGGTTTGIPGRPPWREI